MIARRFRSLGLLWPLLGCGISQPQGGPPSVPPSESSGGAPAVAPAAQTSGAGPTPVHTTIELAEAAAPSLPLPRPRVELQRPSLGEVIEAPLARGYELRLEVASYVLTRGGQGALVSLDGGRPRRWPVEGALKLGDLVAEDAELTDGAHTLLVVLVDADGRVLRERGERGAQGARGAPSPFFLVDFSIGRAAKLPDTPRVFCLGPAGTYYGEDGRTARLELFPVGSIDSALRLRVEGPGLDAWAAVRADRPHRVGGLPYGDVTFTVLSGDAALARCIVTINPEKAP